VGPGSHVLDNGHGEFSVRGAERTFSNYFDHMYLLRFNIFSQPVIFFEKKTLSKKQQLNKAVVDSNFASGGSW